MSLENSLGELIRKMRLSAGKTQIDLANEIGSHQPFISNFEKDRMKPDRWQIIEIAACLGLKDDELNLLLDKANYDRYNPESDHIDRVKITQPSETKAEISKEFNTQLEDLKYLVSSLDSKFEEGMKKSVTPTTIDIQAG
ncbi:helix-turn-helix domain-containing protein, partial [Pseudoalteromonas piscicida]